MTTPPGPERAARPRRWPRVVAVLAVLGLAVAWWVDRQLEPHRLATTVLGRAGAALGLELTYDGDPDYALRPEPRLRLPGFSARQPGATTPLLRADRVEVSLPWSTILDGEAVVITRIELDAPVLDLAALAAWRQGRPAADGPFELPALTDGLRVTDGRVDGDGWRLDGVDVDLPRLVPRQPARADVAGRWSRQDLQIGFDGEVAQTRAGLVSPTVLGLQGELRSGGTTAPWSLQASASVDAGGDVLRADSLRATLEARVPQREGGDADARLSVAGDLRRDGDGLAIDALQLALDGDPVLPALEGEGRLHLADTLALELAGELSRWPAGWPVLPGGDVDAAAPLAWSLVHSGDAGVAQPLSLHVERGDTRLYTRLSPPDVRDWLDDGTPLSLPPLSGSLETPSLEIGGVTLEGVRVRVGGDDDRDGPAAAPAER